MAAGTMVQELHVPVSCKIRTLHCDEETLSLVQAIEDSGVSLLTVHGRTAQQNKIYSGHADWDIIAKIKNKLQYVPVVANGGVSCYADVQSCLYHTGADGVMSSEALLENPRLFTEAGDAYVCVCVCMYVFLS